MEPSEFHWLVGLLEGEGSFMHGPPSAPWQPRISVQMTDSDIVERVAKLFGVGYLQLPKPQKINHKQTYTVAIRGSNAIALMQQLLPFMGKRRQERIREILAAYKERPRPVKAPLSADVLEQIRKDPETNVTHLSQKYGVSRDYIRRVRAGFTSSTAYKKHRALPVGP